MAEIRITSAQLRMKKEALEQMNYKFKETVGRLEEIVQTLNGSWEGESHDAFYQSFQRDQGQLMLFAETVARYGNVLETIIGKYESAEQNSLTIAQSRRS